MAFIVIVTNVNCLQKHLCHKHDLAAIVKLSCISILHGEKTETNVKSHPDFNV